MHKKLETFLQTHLWLNLKISPISLSQIFPSKTLKKHTTSKNKHFLPSDKQTYVCVSEGKKCLFFRKFDVLCILETAVLRFPRLPYYRRPQSLEDFHIQNCSTIANAKLILQKDPIYVSSTKVNLQYNFLLLIFLRLLGSITLFDCLFLLLFLLLHSNFSRISRNSEQNKNTLTGPVNCQLDIMPKYHYAQNHRKIIWCKVEKIAKNLNLGNFLTISRSNIPKLQIFLKNRFHSDWRSYLVLTSGQKPKTSLELFLRKIS